MKAQITSMPWYVGTETIEQANGEPYEVYSVGYADEGKLDYSNSDPFQELAGDIMDKDVALLMAAAPLVRDALQQAVFAMDSVFHITGQKAMMPYIEQAKAALAAAEGK